ncbi:MAG TPA: DUF3800 domain-containing protein [Methylocella sp.]|nr:DUF3800 domain-containing protein [Methylocella sp.]
MNKTIFFDESGNTGLNLLDPQQKFFSVGSTDLVEADALVILKRHFPRHIGQDIKFKKLFRSTSNYKALIDFAKTVGSQPNRFFCFLMDKRFALLCRLIDWLVEPMFHERGYDWYKDDYARSYANLCHLAFSKRDDNEELLEKVTSIYYAFTQDPSKSTLVEMQHQYREIANADLPLVGHFMEYFAAGAKEFENHHTLADFKGRDDLHVTSVVSSVGWWRAHHDEDFDVVHDQSTHFFDRNEIWDLVSSMSASGAVVRVGPKSIRFPLRVKSTTPGDSKLLSSLQICDLIGGFVVRTKSDRLTDEQRDVLAAMTDAGMGKIGFDAVGPDDFYATGLPPLADGPDAVDQVALATCRR